MPVTGNSYTTRPNSMWPIALFWLAMVGFGVAAFWDDIIPSSPSAEFQIPKEYLGNWVCLGGMGENAEMRGDGLIIKASQVVFFEEDEAGSIREKITLEILNVSDTFQPGVRQILCWPVDVAAPAVVVLFFELKHSGNLLSVNQGLQSGDISFLGTHERSVVPVGI